jgi:hypothetical protein
MQTTETFVLYIVYLRLLDNNTERQIIVFELYVHHMDIINSFPYNIKRHKCIIAGDI